MKKSDRFRLRKEAARARRAAGSHRPPAPGNVWRCPGSDPGLNVGPAGLGLPALLAAFLAEKARDDRRG